MRGRHSSTRRSVLEERKAHQLESTLLTIITIMTHAMTSTSIDGVSAWRLRNEATMHTMVGAMIAMRIARP